MKATLDILNQLQNVLVKELGTKEYAVLQDYPDSDRCIKETTLFLVPDSGLIEGLTTSSDECSLDVTLYIICRRKKSDTLMQKVFDCFERVYKLLRGDPSLDGYVVNTMITDFDYYPSTGIESEKAIEVHMTLYWEKDF